MEKRWKSFVGSWSPRVADLLLNCGVMTDLVTVTVKIVLGLGEVRMAGIVWTGGIITRCVENMFSF